MIPSTKIFFIYLLTDILNFIHIDILTLFGVLLIFLSTDYLKNDKNQD